MKRTFVLISLFLSFLIPSFVAQAAILTIDQSALIGSSYYYTDTIGGGIGDVVVMTDGGNASGAGDASGRNDDGYSGPISFGFNFTFYGQTYSQFYANNNGNISFGSGLASYIPSGPTGAYIPVISAFFGDVDTRSSAGVLHIRTMANQVILTWDRVGYFSGHDTPDNSFQMIIRGPGYNVPDGEGTIGFFYKTMGWESTDTSTLAAVGFGDGAGNGAVLEGSNSQTGLNGVLSNHHIWFDQNLTPVDNVPVPASLILLGSGLLGLIGLRRKMR